MESGIAQGSSTSLTSSVLADTLTNAQLKAGPAREEREQVSRCRQRVTAGNECVPVSLTEQQRP